MDIRTPEWVKHAVFYQIFPDRFARSPRNPLPPGLNLQEWGTDPAEQGFQGGDLYGVAEKLDYLTDLGINAIYFNPIFASTHNHRYNTYDYMQIDPILGGNEAFRFLLDEAHRRDVRMVIDGVFNHASRGFWPFNHVLANGGKSPYIDWFTIHDWPLRPYSKTKDKPLNYAAWWDVDSMPKINVANPGARQYIMDVAKYWIEFGADGWRLDVPTEIDDEDFWQTFRRTVKDVNPDAYIVGEIWHEAKEWLQGDRFDAVMNYIFMSAAINFFGANTLNTSWQTNDMKTEGWDSAQFTESINGMMALYDWQITTAQMNMLGSHDTPRLLWMMGDDVSAMKLAVLFQMTMPGAPNIYYGDEIGMSAGGDPHCREAFLWHDEANWNHDLLGFYKDVIAMRHAHPVLRTGQWESIKTTEGCYGFLRRLDEVMAVVVFNTTADPITLSLDLPPDSPDTYRQAYPLAGGTARADGDSLKITVSGRDALVLIG